MRWLLWVRDEDLNTKAVGMRPVCHSQAETNLENVERLKLDVPALVAEEVHYQLEVGFVRDVPGHDVEVRSVQKNFSKELE